MSERESWMPDNERLCMAFDLCDQAWDEIGDGEREPNDSWLDPLRAVVREAVEKALAEQREQHATALLRAKKDALDFAISCYAEEKAEQEARHAAEVTTLKEEIRQRDYRLAEQEARHRREVLEARIEELASYYDSDADDAIGIRMDALRADLAALDAGEEAKP